MAGKSGARVSTLQGLLRDLLSRAGQTDAFLHTIPSVTAWPDDVDEGEECAGDAVGPYRLLRELGKGGMGTVWLAERIDGMINRPVALKLPRGNWQRGALSKRMAREREILAALNHPQIARLYDAGVTNEANPWLALEYVEGRPIDEYCNSTNADIQQRVRLFLNVPDTVAHAHARLRASGFEAFEYSRHRRWSSAFARLRNCEAAGTG